MRTIIALGLAGLLAGPVAAQTVPMTRDTGVPVGDNQDSKVAGPEGPVLLEDMNLIEKLARFDRERIPERVVHARGTGAQGVFVASTDFSKYTKASLFAAPGKETPVFVRFSTVMNFRGSPEAARDPRGFAVKFYTDQGNWDVVGINEPIFFIRDAIKFPDFVHANKPSPVTNVQDPTRAFDFFSGVPESTHMLTQLYTDTIGMPASYRTMDGWGVHAFRLVNSKGELVFAKFHWKSQQGLKGLTLEEQRAADTNYATKDLYDNIRQGNFPKWDLEVQLLTAQQVAQLSYDGFDDTKVWSDVPYVKVGTPQGDVNYEPTTVAGHPVQEPKFRYSQYSVSGMTQEKPIDKQDNFRQAGEFYRALDKHEQDDLIKNLAADLGQIKSMQIKETMVSHFYQADKDYGTRLAGAVGVDIKSVEKM